MQIEKRIRIIALLSRIQRTVKPVLRCHSKIDKKVLKTGGNLVQVESIAFGLH